MESPHRLPAPGVLVATTLATLLALGAPAAALAPPGFVENRGQADPRVAFTAETAYGVVFVTHARELVYVVPAPADLAAPPAPGSPRRLVALVETVAGAAPGAIRGRQRLPVALQWFIGNDPAGWLVGVPAYGRLDLGEVAPGIRLGLRLKAGAVEKVFTVQPGASLDGLRLAVAGAAALEAGPTHELDVFTEGGLLAFTRPRAWQVDAAGRREAVAVAYEAAGATYGFAVDRYDPARPLYVDPLLASTYLGGMGDDHADDVIVDRDGYVYAIGRATSTEFPSRTGAYVQERPGVDIFAAKLDADLGALRTLTFLGGANDEAPARLTFQPNDNFVLTGWSRSADFPTTAGVFQPSCANGCGEPDGVVVILTPTLQDIVAATFLGGRRSDAIGPVDADLASRLTVAGNTESYDFPTTPGAYAETFPGPAMYNQNGFLARLSPDLSTLQAATFYGGDEADEIVALGYAPDGSVIVTGATQSPNLPTTPGAYDRVSNNRDALLARFDAGLTTLLAATYLGGVDRDWAADVVVDPDGRVVCTGTTVGTSFPVTPGVYSWTPVPGEQPFVASLPTDFSTQFSSYLHDPAVSGAYHTGGSLFVAIDPIDGTLIVTGEARDPGFPIQADAYQRTFGDGFGDDRAAFVLRITRNLQVVTAGTFFGSAEATDEQSRHAYIPGDGSVVLVGWSVGQHRTTPGAFQTAPPGLVDGFVAHLSRDLAADPPCLHHGDVTANGRITAADAQAAWGFALGFGTPSHDEHCAADCNGDGRITAGDAQRIHGTALGMMSCVDPLP